MQELEAENEALLQALKNQQQIMEMNNSLKQAAPKLLEMLGVVPPVGGSARSLIDKVTPENTPSVGERLAGESACSLPTEEITDKVVIYERFVNAVYSMTPTVIG